MGVVIIIIGVIIIAISVFSGDFMPGLCGIILIIVGFALLPDQENTNPTALDVYRGKTTLEITYKDSVPIDSIVVFKDNK